MATLVLTFTSKLAAIVNIRESVVDFAISAVFDLEIVAIQDWQSIDSYSQFDFVHNTGSTVVLGTSLETNWRR